jgi:hypothetical protein
MIPVVGGSPSESRFVDVGGIRTHYLKGGSGPHRLAAQW